MNKRQEYFTAADAIVKELVNAGVETGLRYREYSQYANI